MRATNDREVALELWIGAASVIVVAALVIDSRRMHRRVPAFIRRLRNRVP